ncbi:UNVERIFIED_CONTAM: hypothetical protein Sradi_3002700 [Sesamum radiatum]|uniref:Reverse transcriptase Ty1/copia-type domain-containing protein n=1 Tax=Sesamum radiatum TaxID=300843 RepID=A0AAW2S0Z1_SESRA
MDRGFRRSLSEPTLYVKRQGNDTLIVSLYVDDLIYTGNNEKMIHDFKEDMMKTFEMSDLGLMHFFLGIEINQEKEGNFYMSKKYTETLLKKFKMKSCKTVTTPLVTGEKYKKKMDQKVDGSSTEVSLEACYSNCHKTRYYVCHKSVIKIHAESEPRYTDSDWAGSADDMKSTSGYTFSLGSGIFSWASKKQATVAQFSAEAEYIAAAATSNQAIWLRRILEDMGEKQEEPTTIYCDNKSAIAITKIRCSIIGLNISTSSNTLFEKQLPEERLNSSTAALKSNWQICLLKHYHAINSKSYARRSKSPKKTLRRSIKVNMFFINTLEKSRKISR